MRAAARPRHVEVDQHDIGPAGIHHRQRRGAIVRFADDREPGWESNMPRNPVRTTGWSSTTSSRSVRHGVTR